MAKKSVKRFEVRRVRMGLERTLEWTWSLIASNGQFLAGPHESFANRADCMKNLRLVRETDVDTPVMEIPWVEPAVVAGGNSQRAPRVRDGEPPEPSDHSPEVPPATPAA